MSLVHVEVERNTNTVAGDEKIRYSTRYCFVKDGHVFVVVHMTCCGMCCVVWREARLAFADAA